MSVSHTSLLSLSKKSCRSQKWESLLAKFFVCLIAFTYFTHFYFFGPVGSSYHLKWEGLSNSQQLLSNYITFLPELFHLISLESPWLLLRIMQKLLQVNSKHNTEFGGKCVSRRFMAKVDKSNAAQRMDKTWINCICCYCPHCENILSPPLFFKYKTFW